MIAGASLVTAGEANGFWIDGEFLDAVAATPIPPKGLKCRLSHPNYMVDGTGRKLGDLKDFRRDGDKTRCDLHLSKAAKKSPAGNLPGYVLAAIDEDPASLGLSLVFKPDKQAMRQFIAAHVRSGKFVSPDPANTRNLPHLRLAALKAADVIDEPSANTAMFSVQLSAETVLADGVRAVEQAAAIADQERRAIVSDVQRTLELTPHFGPDAAAKFVAMGYSDKRCWAAYAKQLEESLRETKQENERLRSQLSNFIRADVDTDSPAELFTLSSIRVPNPNAPTEGTQG